MNKLTIKTLYELETEAFLKKNKIFGVVNHGLKKNTNLKILPNAGSFTVVIQEYQKELFSLKLECSGSELTQKENELYNKYNQIQWVLYKTNLTQPKLIALVNINRKAIVGIDKNGTKTLNYDAAYVGKELLYLGAFFPNQPLESNTGIFLNVPATKSKATFVAAQFTDAYNTPIPEGTFVSYGSQVKLHIYTQNLLGETLQIKLKDDRLGPDALLTTRQLLKGVVKNVALTPGQQLPAGVSGAVYTVNKKQYVQKAEIKVTVDTGWIFKLATFSNQLDIYPQVFFNNQELKIANPAQRLVVSQNSNRVYRPSQPTGNMPVVVGKTDTQQTNQQNAVNFTFGVFLDGTLNNMYNTELMFRVQKYRDDKKRKQGEPTTGLNLKWTKENETDFWSIQDGDLEKYSDSELEKLYKEKAASQEVYNNPELGENSFENDLSNPARLFKNYIENTEQDTNNKIFKVYVEGVGSHSYKTESKDIIFTSDDKFQGPAFGAGNAGIRDNARKAIQRIANIIEANSKNKAVGTITLDVFGFSRGAAAARHFVHVVTKQPYKAGVFNLPAIAATDKKYRDFWRYEIQPIKNLFEPNAPGIMPPFGYLGQLLKQYKKLNPNVKVKVRFVGIYDTVPHHGLVQSNDIADLYLNDVSQAEYVAHFVADDEHRYNFALAPINSVTKTPPQSGKKGGIEIYYPGVHSDVGGSYVEGWHNSPPRIDVDWHIDGRDLIPLKQELIRQGWFTENDISIYFNKHDRRSGESKNPFFTPYRLAAKRQLSNQYSFIPLYLMADVAEARQLNIFDRETLNEFYAFKANWLDQKAQKAFALHPKLSSNIGFLTHVYQLLKTQTLQGGKPLRFIEPEHKKKWGNTFIDVSKFEFTNETDPEKVAQANAVLKFLRYHYLHWNSTYAQKGALAILGQKDKPEKNRIRHIIK